jgi:hypothetical protein
VLLCITDQDNQPLLLSRDCSLHGGWLCTTD